MYLTFPGGRESFIGIVEDFLEPGFCSSLVADTKRNWDFSYKGETMGGVDTEMKLSRDFKLSDPDPNLDDRSAFLHYDSVIAEALTAGLNMYLAEFPTALANFRDEGYQMQCYTKGEGFYREHFDGAPWLTPERALGIVIYLNDVEEGGETHFPYQGLRVHPKAGSMVLFPANWTHPHAGLMPMSDDKWIISTFIVVND
jgi:2OG-Fe(II) oxygenase superfamily